MKMSATSKRRLMKELSELIKTAAPCIRINQEEVQKNFNKWKIQIDGAPGTLYEFETFELEFTFGPRYPFDSPQVMFTGQNIPVHPHIYSNGHICLSILDADWTPAMSVNSVCLSILSMLSSCKEKIPPPDNSFYVKTAGKNPKNTRWLFHDDKI